MYTIVLYLAIIIKYYVTVTLSWPDSSFVYHYPALFACNKIRFSGDNLTRLNISVASLCIQCVDLGSWNSVIICYGKVFLKCIKYENFVSVKGSCVSACNVTQISVCLIKS